MFYAAAVRPKQKSQRTVKEIMNLWKLRQRFSHASNASCNNKLSWDGLVKHIRETPGIYSETRECEDRLWFTSAALGHQFCLEIEIEKCLCIQTHGEIGKQIKA